MFALLLRTFPLLHHPLCWTFSTVTEQGRLTIQRKKDYYQASLFITRSLSPSSLSSSSFLWTSLPFQGIVQLYSFLLFAPCPLLVLLPSPRTFSPSSLLQNNTATTSKQKSAPDVSLSSYSLLEKISIPFSLKIKIYSPQPKQRLSRPRKVLGAAPQGGTVTHL